MIFSCFNFKKCWNKSKTHILIYGIAIFIRLWLIYSDIQNDIAERIEVSTPVNSFHRIRESYYRMNINVDPYSSDILHEPPIYYYFYKFLIENLGKYLPVVFVICDAITAYALYLFAKEYMVNLQIDLYIQKCSNLKNIKKQIKHSPSDFEDCPMYVIGMYLYNPYIILNCIGCATTTFLNLALALFFYGIVHGSTLISSISLSFATIHGFYPYILISPMILAVRKYGKSLLKAIISLIVFIAFITLLTLISYYIMKNCKFLNHTYGFVLKIEDQVPNIGIYWYFFMEMFVHFKELFIYSYQINATILYLIPLSIKFRKDPVLLAKCFVIIITIFKPYPSVGDFGLLVALLPCWRYLYNWMQQIFISSLAIVVTTTLAPIYWDLWITWGTANANYYFGTNLAFISAYIFILTDVAFAYSKHEYLMKYGTNRRINDVVGKLMYE